MRVTFLVGDYDGITRPVIGRHGGDVYLFADHRHPMSVRQDTLRSVIPLDEIEHLEVVVVDQPPPCEEGGHLWQTVTWDRAVVACRCERCSHVEVLPEPYPQGVPRVVRPFRAAG